MPTSRSEHTFSTLMMMTDADLRSDFNRIMALKENCVATEIATSLDWLLAFLAHANCMMRDAAVLTLRILLNQEPERICVVVPPLLVSDSVLNRAEGYHLIGYLSGETTEDLHPAVLLGLMESELEVRERAAQALNRLKLSDAAMKAACHRAIETLVHVTLDDDLGEDGARLDNDQVIEVFRVAIQDHSGEHPIAMEAVRRTIRRILGL